MDPKLQRLYRIGAYMAFASMFVLLLYAAMYYKERMLLCDAAHIFLRIANDQHLEIQQYRFGSFITQIFPLIAVKLHFPLKYALLAYSVSFNVFYLLVSGILVFILREYKLAILMAMYYLLVGSDTFYWPNNELHQGMSWMFLFFGVFLKAGRKNAGDVTIAAIILLLGGLAAMTHLLVVIPFTFLIVFLFKNGGEDWPFPKRQTVLIIVCSVLAVSSRIIVSKFFANYDSGVLSNLPVWRASSLREAFDTYLTQMVIKSMRTNFWLVPVLLIIGLTALLWERKYFLALWSLVTSVSFFALCCVVFEGWLPFYVESEIMPLAILAATPFVFVSLKYSRKEMGWLLLLFIFTIRLQRIQASSYRFTSRNHFINHVVYQMQQRGISKLALINRKEGIDSRFMLDWAVPSESLLASALMGQNPQRTFFVGTDLAIDRTIPTDKDTIATLYDKWHYNELNHQYFNTDTSSTYIIREFDDFIDPAPPASE